MIDIQKLIALMVERGVAKEAELVGMPNNDIQFLEKQLNLTFPQTYVQFLQNFGHSAGYLSPWMAIYFDDLKKIRSQYELLCATQSKSHKLEANVLIIGNWESIFDYIICDGQPDPVVYRLDLYNLDASNPREYTKNYSEYLQNMVESADSASIPYDFFGDVDALINEEVFG